jgi:hypothetical protein
MPTEYFEQSQNGDIAQPKSDIYTPTETQKYRLGTRYHRPDGRTFHYARAGSTALIQGDLLQSAVDCFVTNEQQDLAIGTASAVGDNWGYATTVTDTITEDLLKDGWYVVSDGSVAQGGGGTYQIKSHPASAAGSVKFTFYDDLPVLISTSAKAGLIMNPYNKVVQYPITTATGFVLGTALTAVTANYYFWCQTWGMASILNTGGTAVGQQVLAGLAVAGACQAQVAAGSSVPQPIIGYTGHTTDDTDWGFVYLQIAP